VAPEGRLSAVAAVVERNRPAAVVTLEELQAAAVVPEGRLSAVARPVWRQLPAEVALEELEAAEVARV
jgi:hypothetical protein